ncbi:hypothetical protein SCP_1202350 [Sparassis crispa]|uniref:DUF6699 domain-containing protein n=1 Tax=Sparassis crispa TaxID=139825 RepID=A0A401H0U2_9APHY|nr:hypothetical protein SCP_1202350 [Sparassis crispa]GBE88009.1 hypothetical protein SCP_1202350 [Sparassis crispa]
MTGRGGWVPHPCPHPHIPPQVFWGSGPVVPRTLPATPFDSAAQALLSGGFPLPGRAPVGWMPGTWPPSSTFTPILSTRHIVLCPWLIPNPANPSMPHVRWDVTQHPSTAKRITGRELVVDLKPKMNDQATYPPVQRAHIYCDLGVVSDLWGPIIVKNRDAVTVRDIVMAIYEYFQIRLSQDEVSYISALGSPQNYEKMVGSMYTRCMITPSLPGYEWSQGMRRVDCLGNSTKFWGLWVTENDDDTWQLNLGILPELRGVWV